MEGVNLKKVVTKYFLLVKFNNFKDSLDVLTALQSKDFMIEVTFYLTILMPNEMTDFLLLFLP